MFGFKSNGLFRLISLAICIAFATIYVGHYNRGTTQPRTDHSELAFVQNLPKFEKWLVKLPPPPHERGGISIPWTLRFLTDSLSAYYDSESGDTWYFIDYDVVGDYEKGYAYCKNDQAHAPAMMGKFQIQCKPVNSHWVRYETIPKEDHS